MNKAKELTAERLRELLEYDPETGVFTRRITLSNRTPARSVAGGAHQNGYRYIYVDRTRYFAHRLAFLYMTGAWPKQQVDHINHERSDNRWANLRDVTNAENQHNRAGTRGTRHMAQGVRTKPWVARIKVGGRQIHLGCFHTEPEAHEAYRAAKHVHHPTAPPC